MNSEPTAVVIATSNKQAILQVTLHSHCEHCGACEGPAATLEAFNSLEARVGETVTLSHNKGEELKMVLIEFVVPLISLITSFILGTILAHYWHIPELSTIVPISILLCGISCRAAIEYDRHHANNNRPSIKAVVS